MYYPLLLFLRMFLLQDYLLNVTGAAFTQRGPTGVIVTVGNGLTVIDVVAELLQPVAASV
jgi:hypothetical protein